MPAFSIAPASASVPPTSEGFPNYLQFQNQGENLGVPTVDTLNFGSGLTATRGTGENANRVTVTASGGTPGGGALFFVYEQFSSIAPFFNDGEGHLLAGPIDLLVETTDSVSWQESEGIRFSEPGIYMLHFQAEITAFGPFPPNSVAGIGLGSWRSIHGAKINGSDMSFSDTQIITISSETIEAPLIYATGSDFEIGANVFLKVCVQRLGDLPEQS